MLALPACIKRAFVGPGPVHPAGGVSEGSGTNVQYLLNESQRPSVALA
jgi:hypothetical protein